MGGISRSHARQVFLKRIFSVTQRQTSGNRVNPSKHKRACLTGIFCQNLRLTIPLAALQARAAVQLGSGPREILTECALFGAVNQNALATWNSPAPIQLAILASSGYTRAHSRADGEYKLRRL
jgi:hypothetical protein